MKRLSIAILAATIAGSTLSLPVVAMQESTAQGQYQSYSDAELDSLLAPIALYPDTILTHILIASTYPLEVVAADRWRQQHSQYSADDVEQMVEDFDWDPSVKALVPFTDILQTLSEDLDWLQSLGDNVLISQSRVLARVQVLRQHALNAGNLSNNEYQRVERDKEVIVIEPTRKEIVYVPYYDTRVVYGSWWHPVTPVYWHRPSHYHLASGFYWGPSIRLSTHFYFGGILWHDRHVVVTRTPVRRYYYGNDIKRVYSREYQPWQHDAVHRRTRYSTRVVESSPTRYVTAHKDKRRLDYSPRKERVTTARYDKGQSKHDVRDVRSGSPGKDIHSRQSKYDNNRKHYVQRAPEDNNKRYVKEVSRSDVSPSPAPKQDVSPRSYSDAGKRQDVVKNTRETKDYSRADKGYQRRAEHTASRPRHESQTRATQDGSRREAKH